MTDFIYNMSILRQKKIQGQGLNLHKIYIYILYHTLQAMEAFNIQSTSLSKSGCDKKILINDLEQ